MCCINNAGGAACTGCAKPALLPSTTSSWHRTAMLLAAASHKIQQTPPLQVGIALRCCWQQHHTRYSKLGTPVKLTATPGQANQCYALTYVYSTSPLAPGGGGTQAGNGHVGYTHSPLRLQSWELLLSPADLQHKNTAPPTLGHCCTTSSQPHMLRPRAPHTT
jgi:hypothetical protein